MLRETNIRLKKKILELVKALQIRSSHEQNIKTEPHSREKSGVTNRSKHGRQMKSSPNKVSSKPPLLP